MIFSPAERSEETSKALAAKREYQGRVEQISKDFDEEKRIAFEITQDMTRQYKGMQEELLTRVIFSSITTNLHNSTPLTRYTLCF